MLVLSDVRKAYGGRTLFAGVSLPVNREDRIGLVGPNGSGKSTLFALMLGLESPDAGTISCQRGMVLGHLPQENAPAGEETVLDLATAISPEYVELRRQIRRLEAGLELEGLSVAEARSRFDHLGGRSIEVRAKIILAGLSFRERDFQRPLREMSGGWVMRAHLARLLVCQPDLLLLDEPTNHLDLEALLWFQDFLKTYPGGLVVISHDREFLNQTVSAIVEIRQGRLFRYRGNYDAFLAQRQAAEDNLWAAYKNQQREIARLQAFIDRFRAKNTKAAQARSKQKQIDRMDKVEAPAEPEATIDFAFPQPARSGLKVITLDAVDFAYDNQPVYTGLDFEARRGQRIALVGPNGAGKSTLLKLLAGVLEPRSGARRLGYQVKSGYYSQYRVEMLDPGRTVFEEALGTPQPVTETFVRTVLGGFLFRGDDVFKQVAVLSGGEKSRLALVKLLLDPPNLLLMDEPTTHLDLASVDALLAALDQFEGTLVFISHDVYFIHSIANHVVEVRDGRLTHYPGEYQYFLDKTAPERAARAAAQAAQDDAAGRLESDGPTPAQERREQKRREAADRQARYRERKAQQERVDQLEADIHTREQRKADLIRALETPETYADSARVLACNREIQELLTQLESLNRDWEAAATQLEAMKNDSANMIL